MKKILLALVLVSLLSAPSFAQVGVGARAISMGSAFVALANDVTAAYFNPAGIVKCGTTNAKISLGAAINNLDLMTSALSNPTTFLQNNFSKNVSFNGNINSLLGIAVSKVGISAVALGNLQMTKPALSVQPSGTGRVTEDITLTLGHSFDLPGAGIPYLSLGSIDVGVNAKYIIGQQYTLAANGATNFDETLATASGTSFDLGAQANLTSILRGGIAIRNLSGSEKWSGTTKTKTLNPVNGSVTDTGVSQVYSQNVTRAAITAIGLAVEVPGTGLLSALEIESGNTHIGVEYPLIPSFLTARGGYITGANTATWTVGIGLNLPVFNLNAAYGTDTKTNMPFAVIDLLSMGF